MVIFKKILQTNTLELRDIEMPYANIEDARKSVLHLDLQYGEPCMWYDAIEYDLPTKKYLILAVGTGHYWGKCRDEDVLTRDMYIGTVLLDGGSLVLHYFLIEANNPNLD